MRLMCSDKYLMNTKGMVDVCSCIYDNMDDLHGAKWYREPPLFNPQQVKADLLDVSGECARNHLR
ncbi:hypothetical protein CRN84_21750 [Budvicia aquatica]|nr:hypothetical protein CRN84_21750 [Budvicia aquatica]